MRGMGRRVLVIEHERDTPAGLLGEWLERRGADVHTLEIARGASHDLVGSYELVVSLGSEACAYDDARAWVPRELALLREALSAGTPVLGICFGSQLLARALGARVSRAASPEIGWLDVESERPEIVAAGPWFQWHFDTFTPPPGARVLARSPAGPQVYVHGASIGIQFHPEVDARIVEGWTRGSRAELEAHGVDAGELLARTEELAGAARAASWELFEACRAKLGLLGGGEGRERDGARGAPEAPASQGAAGTSSAGAA